MTVAADPDRLRPAFVALPLSRLASSALERCRDFGVEHADVRIERLTSHALSLRDAAVEGNHQGETIGLAVRVVLDGTWGFAATTHCPPTEPCAPPSRQSGSHRCHARSPPSE
jgi:TldD protein